MPSAGLEREPGDGLVEGYALPRRNVVDFVKALAEGVNGAELPLSYSPKEPIGDRLQPAPLHVGVGGIGLVIADRGAALASIFQPMVAEVAPDLREALMPYMSRHLALNLYPLTRTESVVKVSVTSQFTTWYWLALLSGALCLAGALMRRKEEKHQPP
ncbi:MAG: hypothetical protein QXJ59_11660 [Thermofilaceae archaeon]